MTSRPSSVLKREAILRAAEEAFLGAGYDSVTMDEIAARSGVAKQTMYSHFGSKEALFLGLVTTMTREAGDPVRADKWRIERADDLAAGLEQLLDRQLELVLTPRVLRLRRVVIGEVARFPALARALAEYGHQLSIKELTSLLGDLDRRGLLLVPDPRTAASQLNWLVMGEPINDAMLLGDAAVPAPEARTEHVRRAVATFLAAHAVPAPTS